MVRVSATRALENVLRKLGFNRVCGVDEVGRGCLAGPVVAGAVVLHPDRHIRGLSDSNRAGRRARGALPGDYLARALLGGCRGIADRDRSDQHPSGVAAGDAARGHVDGAAARSRARRRVPHPRPAHGAARRRPRRSALRGPIAAASIVAKVTRDRQMRDLHAQDPRYGFARHKGYATAEHLAAVRQFGYSTVHRQSFSPPTLALEFDTID